MVKLLRYPGNPILVPDEEHSWERDAAFNGCVTQVDGTYHMVYRAHSSQTRHEGMDMKISSIGYAQSKDGLNFGDHKLLIQPEEKWEIFGAEDPRITFLNEKYYIFYTALSVYPFSANGIKLAVAVSKDLEKFEKHLVTTFNSKAMGLFSDLVDRKMAALLTVHTDIPPAKIALALFDKEEDIWSPGYWENWYNNINSHFLHLLRDLRDQVEIGSPPIKTEDGWLVIYSYIRNYMLDNEIFGIEAVLLDLKDPRKIIGRTDYPLLTPEMDYELLGNVPNIVFPSGALVKDKTLYVYYGAADTKCAVATCSLDDLLHDMRPRPQSYGINKRGDGLKLSRYEGNPIISSILELDWQAKGTFNPAVIYEDRKFHIVYRAQSKDGTSVLGYAISSDGFHIDEYLDYPIYVPREPFEIKPPHVEGNSGCEDPRISKIGNKYYMVYTAFDGINPPRVAITSINVDDFLKRNWKWEKPVIISSPDIDDKDACIVEGKITGTYLVFHRLGGSIWLEITRDLNFSGQRYLAGKVLISPRKNKWDNVRLGIAGPPLETDKGWLLLYHGISEPDFKYKMGALLLDYKDPNNIIGRSDYPILEPETIYEIEGQVPNVVFSCGSVILKGQLYVYYGGGDRIIGVATMPLENLLNNLQK